MTTRKQIFRTFLFLLTILISSDLVINAGNGISLYTPYTRISVPPGESIDYNIDVKNDGSTVKKVDIVVSGLPRDWSYSLKAGGYSIRQISVLPGEKKTIALKVDVPMKVNKGNHQFRIIATNYDVLSLIVTVSEQGNLKTEFTSDQVNMEGHSKSNFNFTTKLKNQTGEKQTYSLKATAPPGWNVVFKPNYKQATAVEIDPNGTSNISVEIKPPYNIRAGTYKIPVQAVNSSTSADLELEVVITGTYELDLTSPTGLLSSNITAGKEKRVELLVKNTGSSDLSNVTFRSAKPKNWDVTFNPDTVSHLVAGSSTQVYATIKADDKAIPGDYVTNITAHTPEVSSTASLRVSVKTPLLWGWLGILIILAVLATIYYLFRKYGRR